MTNKDHPEVIVFPPVIALGTVALSIGLQWLWPLGYLASLNARWSLAIGIVLVIAGQALSFRGIRELKRSGSSALPSMPTTTLVDSGIFGWTRNPIYVGGTFSMVGLALILSIDWLMILLLPSHVILHFGIVVPEERYLELKFGAIYRTYKANVSRYLLF